VTSYQLSRTKFERKGLNNYKRSGNKLSRYDLSISKLENQLYF